MDVLGWKSQQKLHNSDSSAGSLQVKSIPAEDYLS